ncbi:MAG: ABC transporter permease [Verrucomicrobia bacterium]|nr:ABC transporter permease [Verrucomicrobiota bacterium]
MLLETFLQDLRLGVRVLIKEKSFCALAVAVLALGICAVTTQFSVVNGVMLRGFSFPNADRLMSVQFIDPAPAQPNQFGNNTQVFALDYQEIAASQKSFDLVAAYINGSTVNLTYEGKPERYTGAYVTENFFKILGVTPARGRDFTAADNRPGAEKTALISHELWQANFGGAPDIVGKSVRLNGRAAVIIGVMPPGFAFPVNEQLWIPLFTEFPPKPRNERNAQGNTPAVIGLLRPGVSVEQANSEISTFATRLAQDFPDSNKQFSVGLVQPLIRTFTPVQIRGLLLSMLGVCVAVLFLACSNVMNMQFARATLRAKELAIRSSLGATRWRLVRQMLTESLLLATIGGVVGVILAYKATDFLQATVKNLPNPIPSYITFDIDGRVLALIVAITMLAAIVSGVVPAWLASHANPNDALKEGGRGNTSRAINFITRGLVVFQIFLTCIILIASFLQFQSILRQQKLEYGYNTTALVSARMGLMDGDYPTGDARRLFYDRLLRELRASPEVEAAALTSRFRMTFAGNGPIEIEGREYKENRDRPNANFENVTDGYFATLGQKLLEGRDFTADDTDLRQPVAVVNAFFAKKYFGTGSALGRRFRTVGNNGQLFGAWRTIVGVVSDVRMLGPFNNPNVDAAGFYVPLYSTVFGPAAAPVGQQFTTVLVKPRGVPAATFANNLRRLTQRADANLPLYFVGTPAENIDSFLGQNRVLAAMFSTFGVVAMILAAVGLYGVTSFSVNQRTSEFGIRMALGADQTNILVMVLRQGSVQLALGLVFGLGLALLIAILGAEAIGNALSNMISPSDPLTYLAVAVLLSVVSFVATLIPARRATRVDPMIALRAE